MKPTDYFTWDTKAVEQALGLPAPFSLWFRDGSNAAPLCLVAANRWLVRAGFSSASVSVRTVRASGTSVGPSINYGGKREALATEEAFQNKLDSVQAFIFVDIMSGSPAPFWVVSSKQIDLWRRVGRIPKNGVINRDTFLFLVKYLPDGHDVEALSAPVAQAA
jgi:hypothetical protein